MTYVRTLWILAVGIVVATVIGCQDNERGSHLNHLCRNSTYNCAYSASASSHDGINGAGSGEGQTESR